MCLLQVYPDDTNMSVKSACSCIVDPLTRHSEIITKAEFDADMNDMIKSKCYRICTGSTPKRRNHRKADDRSFRDRKKSTNVGVPNPNNPKPQPPQSYNENVDMVAPPETAANATAALTNGAGGDDTWKDFDVVDAARLDRVSRLPVVSDLPKISTNSKQVHFDEDHMVEMIEFADDEASEEGRKCYWEVFARDRCRFKDRISQAEDYLKTILLSDHRQRVYNQRFVPLPPSQNET